MTAGLFWLYFLSERDMKKILMIATGGTIASKETENGLAPAVSSQELLACVPEIGSVCDVHTVQPFNLDSTNICAAHWLQIARIVEENYDLFDGFVVTHGTDTMAYTAAALSYLVQGSAKPVVLTGSQRSVYSRDTDARRNLADAFLFCADDGAYGVRIVFDGSVILGTRAKKTRTRSFNAFSSIDFPAVAVMREADLEISGMLTRTLRALEEMKASRPELSAEIDRIISLMQIDGEHIGTVTVRGEAGGTGRE